MSMWSRLANVFRASRLDSELDEEIQFHIDARVRDLTTAGMTPAAAAAEVRRRFGNRLRWREQSRDVKLLPWLDSIGRDLRLGARMLRRNPMVTGAAVVSLALALGACVVAFTLVDALILRPLPVRHPEELVYLAFPTDTPERPESDTFNDPLFVRLRDASRGQVALFAMSTQVMRPAVFAGGDGGKEQLRTQYVSGEAFDRLGVAPAAGRLLTGQDDVQPGAHPVAILSHAFWMRRFGGDPGVLGRWVTLETRPLQIVGVAHRRFTGVEPGRPTDLWLPYAMYNPRAFGNSQFNWFRIIGRVNRDVRLEQAQSVLHSAFTNFRREYAPRMFGPDEAPDSVARFVRTPLYLRPARNGPSPVRQQFARPLWILGSIAVLVLLIAASNVANLFLARTAVREREMALRLSIGAGRGRLIQQMLVESAIVSAAACLFGLLFASGAAPLVVGMLAPPDDPVRLDLHVGWRLAAFAAGLTVMTTALFGVAPALRASSTTPITALTTGGGRASRRAGAMRPFVAIQVAFGLVVLFVGSLLVLSFARLASVNPGFATADVLLVSLEAAPQVDASQQRQALFEVLDRIGAIPGVRSTGSAEFNALGRAWTNNVALPGRQYESIEVTMAPITAGFLETMEIPLRAGRTFVRGDMDSGAIVVNEAFARQYFDRGPAVGRTLAARLGEADANGGHVIIGVVADARYDLRKPAAPTIYIPLRPRSLGVVHVRVAGDPVARGPQIREAIRATNGPLRITAITSQAEAVSRTLMRERLLALLSGFFALVGLVLAAVGLYGVLSYAVVQRTREIGIRMALGARRLPVIRAIVTEAFAAVVLGAAAGLAGALYVSRFVQALLFEVTPLDFWSLALPLGTLTLAALLAATLPALRATRVNPAVALRYE
jgi:predicted permease